MTDTLSRKLSDALSHKRLNQKAHDEIVRWLTEEEFAEFVPELSKRIEADDWDNLLDQFYRVISFGTGGIRGVMDLGTNRINNYTVRWTSQAYAQYLLKHKPDIAKQGIAIAYDSRNYSQTFMNETARVVAANGIPVFAFPYYRSTPELSFVVRYLKLAGGVVVTASHNPPQFNGWKVYDDRGVQMLPDAGHKIMQEFESVKEIKKISFQDGLDQGIIKHIDESVDQAFHEVVKSISVYGQRDIKIVFSPLHGVGSQNVLPALKEVGFTDIVEVEAQMTIDGNFPTVKDNFPQPEFPVVYEPSIELAKKVKADIILISDPDADRLGMAVPDKSGQWHVLNGNQAAVLMGEFYLQHLKQAGKLQDHSVVMKTSVTTELLRDIAEDYGVEVIGDLLVGFKFIGDRVEHLPASKHFLFGAEESIGYLFGTAYRDKGAETPAIIAAEMAAWCKHHNSTPIDYLEKIHHEYAYYAERLYYKLIEGLGAIDQMNIAMKKLRAELPTEIAGIKVVKTLDRLSGEVRDGQTRELRETRDWDQGDMLSFFFDDEERTAIHVRPSGTEPKMKYYTMVKGQLNQRSKEEVDAEAVKLEKAIVELFESILKTVKVDVFAGS